MSSALPVFRRGSGGGMWTGDDERVDRLVKDETFDGKKKMNARSIWDISQVNSLAYPPVGH